MHTEQTSCAVKCCAWSWLCRHVGWWLQ